MDLVSTLPENLCLKRYLPPDIGYEVWSLQDIPMGIRFGPYHETSFDIDKEDMKVSQEQEETADKEILILEQRNRSRCNWLPYVNYANHEEEANLIALRTKWGIFYISCTPIPANTQLLICDQDYGVEDVTGHKMDAVGDGENLEGKEFKIGEHCTSQNKEGYSDNKDERKFIEPKQEEIAANIPQFSTTQCNICPNAQTKQLIHGCICGSNDYNKRCFQSSDVNTDERTHSAEKSFEFNSIGDTFSQGIKLRVDQQIHNGEKLLSDNDFSKNRLIKRTGLIMDEKIHNVGKPFKCTACGKQFNHKRYLAVHERIHTGEKPFECTECGKKFRQRNHLAEHKRIHTGEKPSKCTTCGKQFNHKSHLTVYERIHTGENPFECTECGNIYRGNS